MPEDQNNQTQNPESMPSNTPENETATTNGMTAPASQTTGSEKNNTLLIVGVLAAALLIIGGGLFYFMQGMPADSVTTNPGTAPADVTEPTATATADEYPEVVAIVNGQEISNVALANSVNALTNEAATQGLDTGDESVSADISGQALTTLVNRTLLAQAAVAAEIEVTDEQVTEEITAIEAQFGGAEAFDEQMVALNLTREEVRADITEQLLIDGYLATQTSIENITVSDSEIQSLYNQVAESGQEVPPLEEVSDQIEAEIRANKQQEAIAELVAAVRADADIEILI